MKDKSIVIYAYSTFDAEDAKTTYPEEYILHNMTRDLEERYLFKSYEDACIDRRDVKSGDACCGYLALKCGPVKKHKVTITVEEI